MGLTALLSLIGALAATKNFLGNFDGADISFFVGLPVAGILYYLFCRSVDVAAETRVAEAEAAALEEAL